MGRIVGAVIAGFLALSGIITVLTFAFFFGLGADRAFKPSSYEPSMLWILIMFVVGFVAAVIGGWTSFKIANNSQGPKWLAVVVLVLGILYALPALTATPTKEPRPSGITDKKTMEKGQTPTWVALSLPVIGVAGVWVGGWRRRSGNSAPAAL